MDTEEDEFGDLYTDILRPSSAPNPPHSSFARNPSPDFNVSSDEDEIILFGKNENPITSFNDETCDRAKLPSLNKALAVEEAIKSSDSSASDHGQTTTQVKAIDMDKPRVSSDDVMGICVGMEDVNSDQPVIPGLSPAAFLPGIFANGELQNVNGSMAKDGGNVNDDWDSDDSEDDLQIVLNDMHGPISSEREEEADEETKDLVIDKDGDQNIRGIEEQQWGEDAAQGTLDGDKDEEPVKGGGGRGMLMNGAGAAKIAYSNHVYHPHHSQFKVSFSMNMALYAFPRNWGRKVVIARICAVW